MSLSPDDQASIAKLMRFAGLMSNVWRRPDGSVVWCAESPAPGSVLVASCTHFEAARAAARLLSDFGRVLTP